MAKIFPRFVLQASGAISRVEKKFPLTDFRAGAMALFTQRKSPVVWNAKPTFLLLAS
jgi:hypothetical protein